MEVLDDSDEKTELGIDLKSTIILIVSILIATYSLVVYGVFVNVLLFLIGGMICIVLAYFRKVFWVYLFLAILMASYFDIVSTCSYQFSLGINGLSIQFIPTLFIVLHIYVNHKQIPFFNHHVFMTKNKNDYPEEKYI